MYCKCRRVLDWNYSHTGIGLCIINTDESWVLNTVLQATVYVLYIHTSLGLELQSYRLRVMYCKYRRFLGWNYSPAGYGLCIVNTDESFVGTTVLQATGYVL